MGGFGSAMGMITSLKNNTRRTKREAFDGWTSSNKTNQGIAIEPVSEEVLEDIRNKIQKQHKLTTIKLIIAMCISIIGLMIFLFI